jgi:hypothetical protein
VIGLVLAVIGMSAGAAVRRAAARRQSGSGDLAAGDVVG